MATPKAGRPTPKPPAAIARSIPARAKAPGVTPRNPPPAPKPNPIKVRAIALGYYDHCRRRIGDVFLIANERAFSSRWMERVDPRTPEKITTSKEALKQKHDEILAGHVTGAEDVLGE